MEKQKKIRIGIDVGGTFTDAVAIDSESFELLGMIKIPTTHDAKEGVAKGIIEVLNKLMEKCDIKADDICFIAHGTTQATNALLEGDVAKVGIITLGSKIEGIKAKVDTNLGNIDLNNGKKLETFNEYINVGDEKNIDHNIEEAINNLQKRGAEAFVATEAFSVDDPQNENRIIEYCYRHNLPASAGNDVSKLYGLKIRTRTAVINASILPKMLEVANMTETSIKNANIKSPLMVMRCDGGVMTVEEVQKRPILTILSGPAAGVAGALMYEKLTDGIFLEVGGTSTDISCVKDGRVMVKYAEVGGHKTYLNSLDVRTVGIGGGSMIQIDQNCVVGVGPRSAHIAGLEYECFANKEEMIHPVLSSITPEQNDTAYAIIKCSTGKKYALTLTGAANICGYVKENDYAYGNAEVTRMAWKPLADMMKMSVDECAGYVMRMSIEKNMNVISDLIKDYHLDKDALVLVGGGGGASSVVPNLAQSGGFKFKVAKNASVISPIGVALAMVRDMVERICVNPTEDDLKTIRKEAYNKAIESGASPASIQVMVEVDSQENKIRATAVGTTELKSKELSDKKLDKSELIQIAANSMKTDAKNVFIEAENNYFVIASAEIQEKYLMFFKKKLHTIRLIDKTGVIKLQRRNAAILVFNVQNLNSKIDYVLQEYGETNDGGDALPNIYIIYRSKVIEICGMQKKEQIYVLAELELENATVEEKLIMIATMATENQRG